MSKAIDLAHKAFSFNEVPVGCLIVDDEGHIIAESYNTKEYDQVATHHAEILAIERASQKLNSWRLIDCSLYVTLEPCPMCMGAIIQSRIKNVYFGAYDPKGGAISQGLNIHQHPNLNHRCHLSGGHKHRECGKILSDFFKQKRSHYRK